MTDFEKVYLHRACQARIEVLRKSIHDTRCFSPTGKQRGKFEPTGSKVEKACLQEIEGLARILREINGTDNLIELLDRMNGTTG